MTPGRPLRANAADGSVLWVSTAARGGIHGYALALETTPLFTSWRVDRLATHDDGPLKRRLGLFAGAALRLTGRCLTDRPDLVHLHSAAYGSFFRKALLLWVTRGVFRVPTVLHLHAGEFEDFYHRCPRPVRALIGATLRRADRVVTLSPALADAVRRTAPAARVTVAENGVALAPRPRTLAVQAPRVLFVGVLIERKDPLSLLRAWAACRRPAGATLCFAGDGPLRPDLEALIQARGLADSVEITGWLSPADVAAQLDRADLLVLPSHFEGQPLALLEGMARGLALLSTRVGGIPDLIEDGVSGRLVPPADTPALTQALEELLNDPGTRERLGAGAYARAGERFDIRRTARTLDGLYRALTRRPAAAARPEARIGGAHD